MISEMSSAMPGGFVIALRRGSHERSAVSIRLDVCTE